MKQSTKERGQREQYELVKNLAIEDDCVYYKGEVFVPLYDVDKQVYLDEYGCKDDCRDIQYTIDGEIVRKRDGYFRKVS